MGANTIVGADLETSVILQGTAMMFLAYGAIVIVESLKKERQSVELRDF